MSTAIRILQGGFGRVALLDMDKPLVPHAHHHCHVLIKASGANTHFAVRDELKPLTDASAVLVNAWERHAYSHLQDGGPRTVILALYIECGWLAGIHRHLAVSSHPHFFPQSCVRLSPAMRKRADDLAIEMLCQRDIPQARLESDLAELVVQLLDPYSEWRNATRLFRSTAPVARDPRIRRAIQRMREHVGEDLDMDRLATESGLSRAHFFTLFRRDTELTPSMYANVLRMEAAIEGLSRTGETIGDLSHRLGFSEQSHLTRFFRQHLGITPTDYRRKADVYDVPTLLTAA